MSQFFALPSFLPGMPDVFGSDANLLLLDPVPDGFRDDDAQRSVRHVEHAARTTVVVLVGHAWEGMV